MDQDDIYIVIDFQAGPNQNSERIMDGFFRERESAQKCVDRLNGPLKFPSFRVESRKLQ